MKRQIERNCPATLLRFLVVIFSLLFVFQTRPAFSATQKPNIIVIFTDDMGYGDLGCYGGKFPTPNIDRLAKEGTKFTEFYVASPICSPSRAGLLTGMYPSRWKINTFLQARAGNRRAGQSDFLEPAAPSMARTLREAGYATAHIGKWHLGGGRDVTNAPGFSAYGYDEFVSTYESPQPDSDLTAKDWIWSPEDKVKRWDRSGYFVDKALDFLSRKKGQPCLINFWPDDVHTPWIPEGSPLQRDKKHGSEEDFKGVLAEYDRQVGRLMSGLKALGLDQNTLVIFTSDNGPGPDFSGSPRTLGMRGRKGSLYEGGIRVPFIVRWPAKTPAGRVDGKSILNAVDLFPAFGKIAGATLPKNVNFDGEDMSAIFFGKTATRKKPMIWEFGRKRDDSSNRDLSPTLAIRDGKWKLLVNADGTGVELYNLETDRNETQSVVEKNQKVAARLAEAALKWKNSLP